MMTPPPSPSTPPGARRPREARVADVSAGARPRHSETGSHLGDFLGTITQKFYGAEELGQMGECRSAF